MKSFEAWLHVTSNSKFGRKIIMSDICSFGIFMLLKTWLSLCIYPSQISQFVDSLMLFHKKNMINYWFSYPKYNFTFFLSWIKKSRHDVGQKYEFDYVICKKVICLQKKTFIWFTNESTLLFGQIYVKKMLLCLWNKIL